MDNMQKIAQGNNHQLQCMRLRPMKKTPITAVPTLPTRNIGVAECTAIGEKAPDLGRDQETSAQSLCFSCVGITSALECRCARAAFGQRRSAGVLLVCMLEARSSARQQQHRPSCQGFVPVWSFLALVFSTPSQGHGFG
ncbi:hypothetical protein GUJ93_ZPchr0005g14505 [Zizania palustris]|uniref:Uncharacterized protein n=1 Tax=Zizania palustris TaxID=103762 RepID=A0A8J5S5X1_ZIZPA|nr:hypothetical protein GUJ93_ZPchr0005g14505 [Zizania palustris]